MGNIFTHYMNSNKDEVVVNKKCYRNKIVIGFYQEEDISEIKNQLIKINLVGDNYSDSIYSTENKKYIEENITNDFNEKKYLYNIQQELNLYVYNGKFKTLKESKKYNNIVYLDCSNQILTLQKDYEFPQNLRVLICNDNYMSKSNSIKCKSYPKYNDDYIDQFEGDLLGKKIILLPKLSEKHINCYNNVDKTKYVLIENMFQEEKEVIVSSELSDFGNKYKDTKYIVNRYKNYELIKLDDKMLERLLECIDTLNIENIDNISNLQVKNVYYYMKKTDINNEATDVDDTIVDAEVARRIGNKRSDYNIYRYYEYEELNDYELTERLSMVNINESDNKLINELPQFPDTLEFLSCNSCKLFYLPNIPPNLKYLDCRYNNITELQKLPESLVVLKCAFNFIDTLPELPDNIKMLNIAGNNISKIDKIPSKLEYYICYLNKISDINYLSECNELKSVVCMYNYIETIPNFNDKLETLIIARNKIQSVPVTLPDSLKLLDISHNKSISEIVKFPESLETFVSNSTSIKRLPKLNNNIKVIRCSGSKLEEINEDVLKLEEEDFKFLVVGEYLPVIECQYCDYKISRNDFLREKYEIYRENDDINSLDEAYPGCKNCKDHEGNDYELTKLKYNYRIYDGRNFRFSKTPIIDLIRQRYFIVDKETGETTNNTVKYAFFKDYFNKNVLES